jgi:hypothetical protein
MSTQSDYVPGACNIGAAEIRRRRQSGWLGLGVTLLAWVLFFVFRVSAPWRLLLFFPAAVSASGFFQAALHFCAAFGMRGIFNFGSEVGKTHTVEQAENKSRQISLYSALVGIAAAAAGFFLTV